MAVTYTEQGFEVSDNDGTILGIISGWDTSGVAARFIHTYPLLNIEILYAIHQHVVAVGSSDPEGLSDIAGYKEAKEKYDSDNSDEGAGGGV